MTAAVVVVELALAACVTGAAINDLRRFEIADSWSIAIALLYAVHAVLAPPASLIGHLLAPMVMFALGLVLFARGWMGGGDVKLLTAVACWTGLTGLAPMLFGTVMAGGALAIVLSGLRALPMPAGVRLFERDAPLPYAVAIAAGTAWWWPVTS